MSDAVELAEVPVMFECWLAGRPLADRSRREYARNVRAYCAWLAETPDRDGWQGDPFTVRSRAIAFMTPGYEAVTGAGGPAAAAASGQEIPTRAETV